MQGGLVAGDDREQAGEGEGDCGGTGGDGGASEALTEGAAAAEPRMMPIEKGTKLTPVRSAE